MRILYAFHNMLFAEVFIVVSAKKGHIWPLISRGCSSTLLGHFGDRSLLGRLHRFGVHSAGSTRAVAQTASLASWTTPQVWCARKSIVLGSTMVAPWQRLCVGWAYLDEPQLP